MTEKKSVQQKIDDGDYENRCLYGTVGDRRVYFDEQVRIVTRLKRDCLEELGRTNHPKAELLWSKAWEMGHANGFSDIWYHMRDLGELLG